MIIKKMIIIIHNNNFLIVQLLKINYLKLYLNKRVFKNNNNKQFKEEINKIKKLHF